MKGLSKPTTTARAKTSHRSKKTESEEERDTEDEDDANAGEEMGEAEDEAEEAESSTAGRLIKGKDRERAGVVVIRDELGKPDGKVVKKGDTVIVRYFVRNMQAYTTVYFGSGAEVRPLSLQNNEPLIIFATQETLRVGVGELLQGM